MGMMALCDTTTPPPNIVATEDIRIPARLWLRRPGCAPPRNCGRFAPSEVLSQEGEIREDDQRLW